jgi:hypothetical protein
MTLNPRTIDQAIKDARNNRDLDQFDDALDDLDHATRLLKENIAGGAHDAVEKEREIGRLAECLGMQGGVLRRKEKYADALSKYQEGLMYERSLGKETYNLGNVIVETLIASPASLPEIRGNLIKELHERLAAQLSERDGQWWYHADWAMFHLLYGKYADAEKSYERFGNKPRRRDFEAILSVLRRLGSALEPVDPLVAGPIARAIAFLIQRQPGA